MPRLAEVFAKRDDNGNVIPGEYVDGYVPLTDAQMEALQEIPVCLVGYDFFQNRRYGLNNMAEGRKTEFFNPQTLRTNHWAHIWGSILSSPFENAIVFTTSAQSVVAVVVSPSTATVSKGQSLKLNSIVTTTGFANKAVAWSLNAGAVELGAKIDESGELVVPANYDTSDTGTAGVFDIEIETILETGDKITVNGVTYTVDASSEDTIAKQITALKSALNDAKVTDYFTIGGTQPHCTLTQKSGYYGQATPTFVFTPATGSDGKAKMTSTTPGEIPASTIIVTATSIYDNSKTGTATITVA